MGIATYLVCVSYKLFHLSGVVVGDTSKKILTLILRVPNTLVSSTLFENRTFR